MKFTKRRQELTIDELGPCGLRMANGSSRHGRGLDLFDLYGAHHITSIKACLYLAPPFQRFRHQLQTARIAST